MDAPMCEHGAAEECNGSISKVDWDIIKARVMNSDVARSSPTTAYRPINFSSDGGASCGWASPVTD
jgi:hypothetical protein